MVVVKSGIITRPPTRDKVGPRPGTIVPFRLAQPIVDLAEQAEAWDIPILGIRGNVDHLEKHGDHTPWSMGKLPGVIYAIDLSMPVHFEQWILARCKSDYDTQWIDYFNINGRQYNAAGVLLTTSDDHHLHVSVAKGFENTHVTLINDFLGDDVSADDVWGHKIGSLALKRTSPAADWLKAGASADSKITKLTSIVVAGQAADETRDRTTLVAITALTDALSGASGGTPLDTAAIVAAIHVEAEKTRKATIDRTTKLLETMAQTLSGQ